MSHQEHSIHKTITTEEGIPDCQKVFEEMKKKTEIADAEARCAVLFKQKQQELEAMKALYKKLLNEYKNQEIIAKDAGNYCDRPGDINQDGAKICDDCCEELYWSKKRESELCPNCDIDESDDEDDVLPNEYEVNCYTDGASVIAYSDFFATKKAAVACYKKCIASGEYDSVDLVERYCVNEDGCCESSDNIMEWIKEEEDEEEKCNTCGKNIDDDDDTKKCGEGCPEYDEGWKKTHEE